MNGMHGIIFSYEKRKDLRELGEIRSASSIPSAGGTGRWTSPCPTW